MESGGCGRRCGGGGRWCQGNGRRCLVGGKWEVAYDDDDGICDDVKNMQH